MKNIRLQTEYSNVLPDIEIVMPPDGEQSVLSKGTIIIKEDEDIPYVPSNAFDSDQVQKNGMAQALKDVHFSTGSDIDMADRLANSLSIGLSDTSDSAFKRVSDEYAQKLVKDAEEDKTLPNPTSQDIDS